MAVDDGLGDVEELAPGPLRLRPHQLERPALVDRLPGHHDPLGPLDHRAPGKRPLEIGVLGIAAQGDVDRALHLLCPTIDDVRKDAALRGLVDPGRIVRLEQRDHRTRRLADDLGDHLERVLAADAQSDECQVRMLALGRRRHVCDLELTGDHLMAELGDDLSDPLEPILALVRNQDA